MKESASLFIFFASAVISTATTAEIIETIEYKYYEISPRSPYEIKPELMRLSPIREGRGSYNGHTDWYINWRYQVSQSPHGCMLRDIKTSVHVIHTLPGLSDNVTDKQTIDVFNKFNEALTQHENNHGNHGLSGAREIDTALSEIPPQKNCRHVSRMVDDIGRSIVQKYIRADNDYDRTTDNGRTEGAVIY